MMGQHERTESLFYYFRLEDQIPEDHLLRLIDQYVDLSFVRERLKPFYSSIGRPSIDPEVLLRLLLIGYLVQDYQRTEPAGRSEDALGLSLVHAAGLWSSDSGPLDIFQEPARTFSPVGHISRGI